MAEPFATLLGALKAAAEPTRLRLLKLLTHGELTVSEMSVVLEQSQPRISRHLKVLCDAGLLDRFREEHWVYYRVASAGIAEEFVHHVSALLAGENVLLQLDERRMAAALAERVKDAIASRVGDASSSPLSELHDVLVDELGGEPIGELLDIGTGTGLILRALGANSARAVGIDISTEALRIARTQAHGAGLSQCFFRRGDMYGLPFAAGSFDTVTMDRVLTGAAQPEVAIGEAVRTLRAGGRLCLVEDFDALADRVGNPLAAIRGWLAGAQLKCERINPFDTKSGHFLLMIGRAPVTADRAA